jgi:long-chain acyl-CoA synthetase
MSRTRYEWAVTDFAIWTAGAVSVPIYEASSALRVGWIVKDSGCAAVVLETPAHATILAEAQADLPDLRHVWQIEEGGLDELRAAGREISDEAVEGRRAQVSRGGIATIHLHLRDDRPPQRVPAHP